MSYIFYAADTIGRFTQFTICRNEPLFFRVLNKHKEEVVNVFKSHFKLLKEDLTLSLFETSSILDYLKSYLVNTEEWIDHDRVMQMQGKEITVLFESYILEDTIPSWLEVSWG